MLKMTPVHFGIKIKIYIINTYDEYSKDHVEARVAGVRILGLVRGFDVAERAEDGRGGSVLPTSEGRDRRAAGGRVCGEGDEDELELHDVLRSEKV